MVEESEPRKKNRYKWLIIILVLLCLGVSAYLMVEAGIVKPKTVIIPSVADKTVEEVRDELISLGVLDTSIRVEEKLSDNKEAGEIMSIYPASGKEVERTTAITITISKGMYYVIEDYTNRTFESVKEILAEKAPNIRIEVEKKATTSLKPGYVVAQSGLEKGTKIDPSQPLTITLTVTESVAFEIENIVGQKLEDVKAMLESKGITPVLIQMELPTDEDEKVEEGVVIRVEPQEGSWYVQEGSNTITLYYYE